MINAVRLKNAMDSFCFLQNNMILRTVSRNSILKIRQNFLPVTAKGLPPALADGKPFLQLKTLMI